MSDEAARPLAERTFAPKVRMKRSLEVRGNSEKAQRANRMWGTRFAEHANGRAQQQDEALSWAEREDDYQRSKGAVETNGLHRRMGPTTALCRPDSTAAPPPPPEQLSSVPEWQKEHSTTSTRPKTRLEELADDEKEASIRVPEIIASSKAQTRGETVELEVAGSSPEDASSADSLKAAAIVATKTSTENKTSSKRTKDKAKAEKRHGTAGEKQKSPGCAGDGAAGGDQQAKRGKSEQFLEALESLRQEFLAQKAEEKEGKTAELQRKVAELQKKEEHWKAKAQSEAQEREDGVKARLETEAREREEYWQARETRGLQLLQEKSAIIEDLKQQLQSRERATELQQQAHEKILREKEQLFEQKLQQKRAEDALAFKEAQAELQSRYETAKVIACQDVKNRMEHLANQHIQSEARRIEMAYNLPAHQLCPRSFYVGADAMQLLDAGKKELGALTMISQEPTQHQQLQQDEEETTNEAEVQQSGFARSCLVLQRTKSYGNSSSSSSRLVFSEKEKALMRKPLEWIPSSVDQQNVDDMRNFVYLGLENASEAWLLKKWPDRFRRADVARGNRATFDVVKALPDAVALSPRSSHGVETSSSDAKGSGTSTSFPITSGGAVAEGDAQNFRTAAVGQQEQAALEPSPVAFLCEAKLSEEDEKLKAQALANARRITIEKLELLLRARGQTVEQQEHYRSQRERHEHLSAAEQAELAWWTNQARSEGVVYLPRSAVNPDLFYCPERGFEVAQPLACTLCRSFKTDDPILLDESVTAIRKHLGKKEHKEQVAFQTMKRSTGATSSTSTAIVSVVGPTFGKLCRPNGSWKRGAHGRDFGPAAREKYPFIELNPYTEITDQRATTRKYFQCPEVAVLCYPRRTKGAAASAQSEISAGSSCVRQRKTLAETENEESDAIHELRSEEPEAELDDEQVKEIVCRPAVPERNSEGTRFFPPAFRRYLSRVELLDTIKNSPDLFQDSSDPDTIHEWVAFDEECRPYCKLCFQFHVARKEKTGEDQDYADVAHFPLFAPGSYGTSEDYLAIPTDDEEDSEASSSGSETDGSSSDDGSSSSDQEDDEESESDHEVDRGDVLLKKVKTKAQEVARKTRAGARRRSPTSSLAAHSRSNFHSADRGGKHGSGAPTGRARRRYAEKKSTRLEQRHFAQPKYTEPRIFVRGEVVEDEVTCKKKEKRMSLIQKHMNSEEHRRRVVELSQQKQWSLAGSNIMSSTMNEGAPWLVQRPCYGAKLGVNKYVRTWCLLCKTLAPEGTHGGAPDPARCEAALDTATHIVAQQVGSAGSSGHATTTKGALMLQNAQNRNQRKALKETANNARHVEQLQAYNTSEEYQQNVQSARTLVVFSLLKMGIVSVDSLGLQQGGTKEEMARLIRECEESLEEDAAAYFDRWWQKKYCQMIGTHIKDAAVEVRYQPEIDYFAAKRKQGQEERKKARQLAQQERHHGKGPGSGPAHTRGGSKGSNFITSGWKPPSQYGKGWDSRVMVSKGSDPAATNVAGLSLGTRDAAARTKRSAGFQVPRISEK
ncbi:unnamed protein product [Amoebophrya sp. A120]|nr:unnamed protein product [Amoebophrya sp. A120]|eukprot:GSA120T00022752001.1